MKLIKRAFILVSILIVFMNGSIRHDVDENLYRKLASKTIYDCAGILFYDTLQIGSCVAIDKNHIITASHCLLIAELTTDTVYEKGRRMIYYNEANFTIGNSERFRIKLAGKTYNVKNIIVHPKFDLDTMNFDIAILETEEEIANIIFPELSNTFDELNDTVTAVGYGVFCKGNSNNVVANEIKLGGNNIIDNIAGYKYPGTNNKCILQSDFDNPSSPRKFNSMGDSKALPLEYCILAGDSGSPLFSDKNGKNMLIGIGLGGSFKNFKMFMKYGYYGSVCEWTRISVFMPWITKVL